MNSGKTGISGREYYREKSEVVRTCEGWIRSAHAKKNDICTSTTKDTGMKQDKLWKDSYNRYRQTERQAEHIIKINLSWFAITM